MTLREQIIEIIENYAIRVGKQMINDSKGSPSFCIGRKCFIEWTLVATDKILSLIQEPNAEWPKDWKHAEWCNANEDDSGCTCGKREYNQAIKDCLLAHNKIVASLQAQNERYRKALKKILKYENTTWISTKATFMKIAQEALKD